MIIMIKTDKQLKVPKWSKNEINRWADYIELRCLYMDDHLVSKDDVLDIFIDEDLDELQRGEAEHSLKYDKLSSVIGNYYEIIKYRKSKHPEYYPFDIEDDRCIVLKDNLENKHLHYIYLLLCTSLSFMDQSSMQKITHAFEKYCCPFMRLLVPVDARTELFGTTRDTNLFHGNLRSRIEQLAEFLGAQTTKTMDADKRYDRIKAGDAGLDIVSFLKLDEASHIPVALAQCTCSYDEWINKQESINSDTWRTRIDPIAPFWRYMYVPFYCHNASGKFEQLTDIHTCLIDRQRILCLLDLHHELFEQLESLQLQVLINNIW